MSTENQGADAGKIVNPANKAGPKPETKRIPMSVPQRKLEVDPIPGYHLYWFIAREVPRAQQASYEFVDQTEVRINQLGVATDKTISGSTDLGSKVSVFSGYGEDGKSPESLYLMKLRLELYNQDTKALQEKNRKILAALATKKVLTEQGEQAADANNRYVKTVELSHQRVAPQRR